MAQITPFTNMPNNSSELPFISILVMGYNQGEFMRTCAASVLSQQYEGKLEIIFCDDCSTDNTFEIMQELATAYKGPHKVIIHRCPVNGKVAVNMNVAVSLSHGDWLMRVDGDDILHPDRVKLTAHAICKYPNATAISGKLQPFETQPEEVQNPTPEQLEYIVADRSDYVTGKATVKGIQWWGCMMTVSRRIFSEFGDLPPACGIMDDTFFASRALMLGQFVIIRNGYLLYYRRHSGNISSFRSKKDSITQLIKADHACRDYYKRSLHCHAPILQELELYTATHPDCKGLLEYFRTYLAERERQALFWEKSWKERIADAGIKGAWWRKIPWALRTLCPFTWALAKKLGKH